jgi:ABC-type branched-subunit amino acid transport system ATPase component
MESPVITPIEVAPVRALGDGADGITVDRLTKKFGSVTAVDDSSFTLKHGTVTGFLGPNGAGKTRRCGCSSG